MDIILKTIDSERFDDEGRHFVTASMISDTKNIQLPETGQSVNGLSEKDYIDAGSTILTASGDVIIRGLNDWGAWL